MKQHIFKRKASSSQELSTASLPDIVFMLLFFFMVTTVLRQTTLMVKQQLPQATQLTKLERKSLVSHIFVGQPLLPRIYGNVPKIQVNDVFIEVSSIVQWVNQERDKLSEVERDKMTISLRGDVKTKMGIIVDVQEKLRDANARKVLYNALQPSIR